MLSIHSRPNRQNGLHCSHLTASTVRHDHNASRNMSRLSAIERATSHQSYKIYVGRQSAPIVNAYMSGNSRRAAGGKRPQLSRDICQAASGGRQAARGLNHQEIYVGRYAAGGGRQSASFIKRSKSGGKRHIHLQIYRVMHILYIYIYKCICTCEPISLHLQAGGGSPSTF